MESGITSIIKSAVRPVILLTGCINPEGMSFTKLQNPEQRRNQYLEAISYYLNKYTIPVLFVENSNIDITPYLPATTDHSRLEIITFQGNNFDKSLGKGYGEMAIINHALLVSKFIKNASFVFKITGRHKVLNLQVVISQYVNNPDTEILVDLSNMFTYADAKCWGSTPKFLEEVFMTYWKDINDSKGVEFEILLAKAVHKGMSMNFIYDLMKNKPRYSGSSGTHDKPFDDSWFNWFPGQITHRIKYFFYKR